MHAKDKCNWTPFHYDSNLGYENICQPSLDYGTNFKLKGNYGKTCENQDGRWRN